MKSFTASLRTLVLPFGATTGPRIELDGITGEIRVYDTSGDLYASITPAGGIRVQDPTDPDRNVRLNINEPTDPDDPILSYATGDADENEAGHVTGAIIGAGATRRPQISIASPIIDAGAGASFFRVRGSSQDGSVAGELAAALGGVSYSAILPFGNREALIAGADDALVAGVEEQFDTLTLSQGVILGRWYRLEGEASFDNTTTRVIFRLRFTTDGSLPTTASTILKASVFNTTASGSTGGTGRVVRYWQATFTGTLRVGLFLEAGAGITALGSGDQNGFLAMDDLGDIV